MRKIFGDYLVGISYPCPQAGMWITGLGTNILSCQHWKYIQNTIKLQISVWDLYFYG